MYSVLVFLFLIGFGLLVMGFIGRIGTDSLSEVD